MDDPYEVLGIHRDASEEEIRTRYLQLVREFPPERDPETAAKVRAAYDALRDPVRRLHDQLFDVKNTATLQQIAAEQTHGIQGKRFPTELLLSLGRS